MLSPADRTLIQKRIPPVVWAGAATLAAYGLLFGTHQEGPKPTVWVLLGAPSLFQLVVIVRLSAAMKEPLVKRIGRGIFCLLPTLCLIGVVSAVTDGNDAVKRGF